MAGAMVIQHGKTGAERAAGYRSRSFASALRVDGSQMPCIDRKPALEALTASSLGKIYF